MPTPKEGESKSDFISRCVPIVTNEGTADNDAAVAKCNGIWEQNQKRINFKALDLWDKMDIIRADWDASYGNEPPYLWPTYMFDDHIICAYSGRYIWVDYEMVEGVCIFGEPETWRIVELDFKARLGVIRKLGPYPIKAVEDAPERYKAYVVKFGDAEHLDLEGTYFTKQTNYHLDWFKTRPWLYHHGMHPMMGTVKVGEWDTFDIDDEGVFFEGELEASFKYKEQVKELLSMKCLFPSTGALGYLVKCAEDGWLSDWPIVEASSTVTPAEFRIGAFTPAVVKAIKTLEGGSIMPEGSVAQALEGLTGKTADEMEAELNEQAPEVPEEEVVPAEESEEASAPEAVPEEPKSAVIVPQQVETNEQLIKAVQGLDQLVKRQQEEIKALQLQVSELAKSTQEQVKAAIVGPSWFESLYINSQQGEPKSSNEAPAPKAITASTAPGEELSPYMRIRQAQGLQS